MRAARYLHLKGAFRPNNPATRKTEFPLPPYYSSSRILMSCGSAFFYRDPSSSVRSIPPPRFPALIVRSPKPDFCLLPILRSSLEGRERCQSDVDEKVQVRIPNTTGCPRERCPLAFRCCLTCAMSLLGPTTTTTTTRKMFTTTIHRSLNR